MLRVRALAAPPEDVRFITSTHMAPQLSAIPAPHGRRALYVCGTQAKYPSNKIYLKIKFFLKKVEVLVSLSFSIVKYIEILCVKVFLAFSGKFFLIVVGGAVLCC